MIRFSRFTAFLLLLALIGLPLVSGCQPGTPLGPQIAVDSDPQKAIDEGAKREKDITALTFPPSSSETDKEKAKNQYFTDVANYYGAVSRRFAGTDTALKAELAQARIYDQGLKNKQQALSTVRAAAREYPGNPDARAAEEDLTARMNGENSKLIGYQVLHFIVGIFGNDPSYSYVLTIFFISAAVTLVLWPIRVKQYSGMKEMQRFQPEMKRIQERYKDDKALQQEKLLEFQKKHGFNPLSGCLPVLLQWPVLWGLYQGINQFQFEFAKAHFLWINPTAAQSFLHIQFPAPFGFLNGAVAPNLGQQDLFLLLFYAVSMYFQSKLQPTSPDPAQAEQQKMMATMMPAMFFIMMLQWHLPSAFVLYWFLSNVMSVTQQWFINRSLPTPPPLEIGDDDNSTVPGGGKPSNGNGISSKEAGDKTLTANAKLVSPKNRRRK